jgi:hypothetical protein
MSEARHSFRVGYRGEQHPLTAAFPDAFAFGIRNDACRIAIDPFPRQTGST